MYRRLVTLGLLLIAIGEVVLAADRSCFSCSYTRDDKQKVHKDCLWPKSDDEDDVNSLACGCGDPDAHCAKLEYRDDSLKKHYIKRYCLTKALCDSSSEAHKQIGPVGKTGQLICCQGDNCNSASTNSAGVFVLTLFAVLAFTMGFRVQRV